MQQPPVNEDHGQARKRKRRTQRDSEVEAPAVSEQPPLDFTVDTQAVSPFGLLDQPIKVYFRSVMQKLEDDTLESFAAGSRGRAGGNGNGVDSGDGEEDTGVDSDKRAFVANVHKEMEGNELKLATDPECSLLVQKILPVSSDVQVRTLLASFSGSYVTLFRHFSASHVLQDVLLRLIPVLDSEAKTEQMMGKTSTSSNTDSLDDAPPPMASELVARICEQLRGFWRQVAFDRHGSFIVRLLFSILGGHYPKQDSLGSIKAKKFAQRHNISGQTQSNDKFDLPESLRELRQSVAKEFAGAALRDCKSTLSDPSFAPVIASYFDTLDDKDSMVLRIVGFRCIKDLEASKGTPNSSFEELMHDRSSSRVIELILKVASDKLFAALNATYFRGNIRALGKHPIANFVIQSLLQSYRTEKDFVEALDELAPPVFGEFLFGRNPLIALAVLRGSKRFSVETKTRVVRDMVYKEAQGVSAPAAEKTDSSPPPTDADVLASLVFLMRGATSQNQGRPAPAGSNIIVELATGFGPELVKPLGDAILKAGRAESYVRLFSDPVASHAFQALFTSADVPRQVRQRVLVALLREKTAAKLASDRNGSHVLDALWAGLDVSSRERLAAKMAPFENEVRASPQGSIMWRKLGLDRFKHNKISWRNRQLGIGGEDAGARDVLKEIMGVTRAPGPLTVKAGGSGSTMDAPTTRRTSYA